MVTRAKYIARHSTHPIRLAPTRALWMRDLFRLESSIRTQVDTYLRDRVAMSLSTYTLFGIVADVTGGISLSSLAAKLGISPSRTSRLVQFHVRNGHLARHEDSIDRRITRITLGTAGARMLDKARGLVEGLLTELIDPAVPESLRVGMQATMRQIYVPLSRTSPVAHAAPYWFGTEHRELRRK
jgi:DNA-binding MarR family transcriptional regulator